MGTLSGQATQDHLQAPEVMKTFDLFLVPSSPQVFDGEAIRRKLADSPWLRQDRSDPTQLVYHNEDNSVRFFILLDPALLENSAEEEPDDDDLDAPRVSTSVLPAQNEIEEASVPVEGEDEPDMVIETPTVTINIPLFQPSEVAREAIAFLLSLSEAAELDAIDPQVAGVGGGEAGRYDAVELYESWIRAQKSLFLELEGNLNFIRWSDERSRNFFSYASSCSRLRKKYRDEGLAVLPIQPASYNDDVLSLCVWRSDVPAVIPMTDLVLLERVGRKKTFFGRKKVAEEILISGEELWKILSPFAQVVDGPAPMLVFRDAALPPSQVINDLAELKGEATAAAKRTGLDGVIDFDLPTATPGQEGNLED